MRFDKVIPTDKLKPYIKYFVISEDAVENTYKIFPSASMVIGFQYQGQLSLVKNDTEIGLTTAGITGISDSLCIFKNSRNIGTILVFFNAIGFTFFTSCPASEVFNQSVSLENIFDKYAINETEEKLSLAKTDRQRIQIVEQFLLSQLRHIQSDKLIIEAVKLIYDSNGTIKISDLNKRLFISPSPLEKRFKKLVGTTPKKFASLVRFNRVLDSIGDHPKSLTDICYENNFFDQAHFIKDFRQYTGDTPDHFKHSC